MVALGEYTRASNTGSSSGDGITITEQWFDSVFSKSYFDWYQVTFNQSVHLELFFKHALNHWDLSVLKPVKPRFNQYEHAQDLMRGDRVIFHACYGGCNPGLHLVSTGSVANDVYEWLSETHRDMYSVSRADVRVDTVEPGMFDYLYKQCKELADAYRVKRSQMGDWDVDGSPSGRTYYLGGDSSVTKLRLYEKGKKDGGNPNWVRFEIQVRPAKAGKFKAAGWSAEDFWRASGWSASLYCAVLFRSKPIKSDSLGTVWRASDSERAMIALVRQYGKLLESKSSDLPNGWADIGLYLKEFKAVAEENAKALEGFGCSPYDVAMKRLLDSKSHK